MSVQGTDRNTVQAMKLNRVEGGFAVASDNLAGPYIGLFALALGATPSQMGMLSAFPALIGNLLQIPYGVLTERLGNRRLMVLIGAGWLRLSWLLIAFIPFVVEPEIRVPVFIALVTVRAALGNLGVPAWTSIQADLIPKAMRGRYYAARNMLLNTCGLAATLVATRLLGLQYPFNYQILLVLAFILGSMSWFTFARISVAERPRVAAPKVRSRLRVRLRAFMKTVRDDSNFSNYCISAIIWHLGVSMVAPITAIYFIQELQGFEGYWAIMTGASIVAGILCQRYWGRLIDRFGQKPVMLISGVGAVCIPLFWFVIPYAWLAIPLNFWAGFMWGGYNLAAFNLLLDITPEDSRATFIGIFNTLLGVASAIGPLTAGFLAELIGFRPIFILAALLRLAGLLWFRRHVDTDGVDQEPMVPKDLLPWDFRRRLLRQRG